MCNEPFFVLVTRFSPCLQGLLLTLLTVTNYKSVDSKPPACLSWRGRYAQAEHGLICWIASPDSRRASMIS